MASSGLELIRSASVLSKDLLPSVSQACVLPAQVENSLCVATAGLDGFIRLVQFEDGVSPSNASQQDLNKNNSASGMELDSTGADKATFTIPSNHTLPDVIVVGKDSYPILSVASVSRDPYTCIAFGGLGRHVQLAIRTPSSHPQFQPLVTIDTPAPTNAIYLQTLSFNKRDETVWNIRVFVGSQDKAIHLHSVSITIGVDGIGIKAQVFHHLVFVGHVSYVRSIAFLHSETGEPVSMISGSDDFTIKSWPLNLLETDKVVRCTTYEAHEDDIVAVDCKAGWVVSGSKDKSVGFLDLNKAKTVRAEKVREVKIVRIPVGSVVRSVLLSDDASMAIVGCGDGTVKIFQRDDVSWSITATKKLHNAPIDTLLLTQNVVVTTSQDPDRSVAVWTIPNWS